VNPSSQLQAIQKAMKVNKIDKPGKVYVVTRKTKAGSMGTSSGAKVRDILRRVVCCRVFVCVYRRAVGARTRDAVLWLFF
jgi:acetyl-CoA carboxylase beta subunit